MCIPDVNRQAAGAGYPALRGIDVIAHPPHSVGPGAHPTTAKPAYGATEAARFRQRRVNVERVCFTPGSL